MGYVPVGVFSQELGATQNDKMLIRLLLIATLAVLTISVNAQVTCYISSSDLLSKTGYDGAVTPKLKDQGPDYVSILKMLGPSGKKAKVPSISMAIEYEGDVYINFRYCIPYQNVEVYVKPTLVGRYTIVVIDNNTSPKVRSGGSSYGGGLQGVLLKESGKWGASWEDSKGGRSKIILFDLTHPTLKGGRSLGNLLTRKDFNEMLNEKLTEPELESLTVEDVITLIAEKNH